MVIRILGIVMGILGILLLAESLEPNVNDVAMTMTGLFFTLFGALAVGLAK